MWMSGCELIEYARVVRHFQYRGKRACPSFKQLFVYTKAPQLKQRRRKKSGAEYRRV